MLEILQKEETLKRISDAIDSFQFLVRDGANEYIWTSVEDWSYQNLNMPICNSGRSFVCY